MTLLHYLKKVTDCGKGCT